jgi:hypothetical protein
MKDELVDHFDKAELLSVLQRNEYHSAEVSESEDDSRPKLPDGKNFVHVYDHPWRSDTVNIIHIYYNLVDLFIFFIFFLKIVENAPS